MNEFINKIYINVFSEGRFRMLLEGLGVTIKISLGAIILGVFIGFIVAICRLHENESEHFMFKIITKLIKTLSDVYIDVIRGTPVVIQILIISTTLFKSTRNAGIWIGIVALGINSGAYIAEIIRAGILSIDKGQTEAGRSLGLSKWQTLVYIVVPQSVKNILPSLVNEFIALIKETAVIGYIAVEDITHIAKQIMGKTFSAIPFFAAGIMYFIVIKILIMFMRKIEAKIRMHDVR